MSRPGTECPDPARRSRPVAADQPMRATTDLQIRERYFLTLLALFADGKDPCRRACFRWCMDPTPTTDAPALAGLPRRWLAWTGTVVLVLSVWAFTEDTTAVRTEPGVRVDPAEAYNPVAAGERLPDGFRQLLPRDAIRPVYEPQFVEASSVPWPDHAEVIGVAMGGEAKAYPVSFLNGRELVVDEIDHVPILVSW